MTVYHGKILELVAIENCKGKSYLHLKVTFEQEDELYWEVDGDTAENLLALSTFDDKHKYRLSLHTTVDTITKQYVSFITKTYRNQSERIYFSCTQEYIKCLDSIKNTQSVSDFKELPFIFTDLSAMNEKKIEQKVEQHQAVISKGYKLPSKWISVAMMSVIFLILFGYSNHSNGSSSTSYNITTPKAEVKTAEVKIDNNNSVITPVTTLEKNDSTQPSLPSIQLDDAITFSIPEGHVSLTFDDGPSKYTMEIVDILKKYKAGGTFFFIGANVKKHPESVQYVQSNHYSIGNHSMNHVKLWDFSFEEQEDEFIKGSKAIEEITNEKVVLFRPPYAAFNEQTTEVVHHNQNKMILWNRDPKDWKTRDADKIFEYIRDTETSGSIILLHESQAVIDALPRIIEHLQEQNLKIVNLE